MATYKVVMEVASAHNLMPMDGQGSSSACVELCFDGQRFRTAIKEKDLNPVWDERFYFDLSDPSVLANLSLEACVYNVNKSAQGASSFIGRVRIAGTSFLPHSNAVVLHRYELEKRNILSRVRGELALKLYIIDEASIRDQEPSLYPAAMWLCVEVVRAYGLMPKDDQGSASTCVELIFDYFRHRTAVKEKDLNPVWNKRFYFSVSDPSNLPELHHKAYVYHVNKLFKGSESLVGKVRVDGASFLPLHDAKECVYSLQKGRVFSFVRGGLALKVYTTDDTSVRSPNPPPPMDRVIFSPGLHVSNNLESILRDQSSRPHDIPLQHLKEITDNFSHERILGQGGFGVVYKSTQFHSDIYFKQGLLKNGEMIAVKKIVSSLRPGLQKQFENEVYHLMMLKHPNIVRFVGYCYETQSECLEYDRKYVFAEMAERLLCLEYLPKGSLDKYLSDESSGLDWNTRYKIIEGICYGLCHLHEHIDKPIVHLDLKPANILLDENMMPKIRLRSVKTNA